MGVLKRGERDKDNEICLKEGGAIKILTTVLPFAMLALFRFCIYLPFLEINKFKLRGSDLSKAANKAMVSHKMEDMVVSVLQMLLLATLFFVSPLYFVPPRAFVSVSNRGTITSAKEDRD